MSAEDQTHDWLDTTNPNTYLWTGTFDIWNKGGPLEHYYNTYAITRDGKVAGVYNPRDPRYTILSEFAGIVWHLDLLARWNMYEMIWRDALTAALEQAANTEHEKLYNTLCDYLEESKGIH